MSLQIPPLKLMDGVIAHSLFSAFTYKTDEQRKIFYIIVNVNNVQYGDWVEFLM